MHKILPVLVILGIFALASPLVNSFQSRGITNENVLGKKTVQDFGGKKYLGNSIDKLQEVESKVKNKEEKNRIKEVLQDAVNADKDIDNHISSMEARPSYVKFIMGPDYKNAGQVRSTIVHLQNDIRKLDKIEEKSDSTTSATITETKATLQSELTAIETKLYNNLQGFSLFGWLAKLLTGFTPTPTPTVTPVPTFTPEASASASPVGTLEPTVAPSASPTVLPTVVPTATP